MKLFASPLMVGCLATAACQQATPPSADPASLNPQASKSPAQEVIVPGVNTLTGEWRVAAIDGRSVDGPVGLALSANSKLLWWQPQCAGLLRAYRIDRGKISFGSAEPPKPAGSPTPPVCAIGLPQGLDDVFRTLDGPT